MCLAQQYVVPIKTAASVRPQLKVMDIYPEFAEDHSEIPWRSMRGMRNRIAHGYFDINLDVLWDTVQTALPELAAQISGVIR